METFVQYFMNDEGRQYIQIPFESGSTNFLYLLHLFAVMYSPYFPHIIDAWNKRHHPNLKFVFYEDMKKVGPFIFDYDYKVAIIEEFM